MTREPRLGIDIGRVIVAGDGVPDATGALVAGIEGGDLDTAFFRGDEASMLATPEVSGAFDAIAGPASRPSTYGSVVPGRRSGCTVPSLG